MVITSTSIYNTYLA